MVQNFKYLRSVFIEEGNVYVLAKTVKSQYNFYIYVMFLSTIENV